MKSYILIIFAFLFGSVLSSCKKSTEENLTPSGIDDTYKFPQGDNPYDKTILNYYQQYGSYLLYKFTDKDAFWFPTGFKYGYEISQANTDNVPALLDLFDKSLFSKYPTSFLKRFLPAKILLCSKVDSIYTRYVFTPVYAAITDKKKVPAYYSYDNIAINYGDASINSMTAAEKLAFLARVNLVFFQSINERALIKPTIDFNNSADYITTNATQAAAYNKGIISLYYSTTPTADWNAYVIAMISLSEADLNRSVPNSNTSYLGILNPAKDTNGLIKKRYNIVRNFFINTYQVDLQKIGDASKGI